MMVDISPFLKSNQHSNLKKRKTITPKTKKAKQQTIAKNNSELQPFWDTNSATLSSKMWLPTENTLTTLQPNKLNSSFRTIKTKSWFSTRVQVSDLEVPIWQTRTEDINTCVQEQIKQNPKSSTQKTSMSSVKKIKTEEVDEKPPAGKTKKIRLFPTPEQKQILLKWFGTARWTYNQCVASCAHGNQPATLSRMCGLHITSDALGLPGWVKETPYDIRSAAADDFLIAFKTQKKMVKQGKRQHFAMKFRSKRADQSIVIHSKHYNNGKIYPTIFGKTPLQASEPLPEKLKYDSRLIRDKCGHFFLCIPEPLEKLDYIPPNDIIALDPGVRTFMAGYDPIGKILEIGSGDMTRIYRLCSHMDKLQTRFQQPTTKAKKRYRLKKAWKRMQQRVRNLIDEVHKKTTLALVKSYKTILLPKFETSQMVKRATRKIRSNTARGMLTWAHYRFQQRLIDKTREYRQCQVIIVDESFTSKTCGQCGHIHQTLGGNKIFKCPKCNVQIDRDINGARNILLKFLTDFQPKSAQR